MSDLAIWRARAADPDVVVAAEVWTDQAAPTVVLRSPPADVLEYLVDFSDHASTTTGVTCAFTMRTCVRRRLRDSAQAIKNYPNG
jgi:hypothetical protein